MYQKFANCKRKPHEMVVNDHLSVTPKEMMEMAIDGTPISAQNLGMLYDEGFTDLEFQPDLEHRRGVDISDMWQASRDFESNIRKAKREGKFTPVESV